MDVVEWSRALDVRLSEWLRQGYLTRLKIGTVLSY